MKGCVQKNPGFDKRKILSLAGIEPGQLDQRQPATNPLSSKIAMSVTLLSVEDVSNT